MKQIKKFEDLHQLGVSEELLSKLLMVLREPFDNDDGITAEFWENSRSSLIFAEHLNRVDLKTDSSEVMDQVRFVCANPEFVERLETTSGVYLLALAIVHDFGSGVYLLIPESMGTRIEPPLTASP